MSERKAFNFYKSYYDTGKLLNEKDRLIYYDALFERQFNGIEPKGLKGSALLAYTGQKYSIDSQIKGWEDKTGIKLQSIDNHPTEGGMYGGLYPPSEQEKEQEKGEVQVKEKEQLYFPFESEIFLKVWALLLTQPKWKKKSNTALQASLKKLSEHDEQTAIKMMENTIAGEWQGLFEIKQQNNKQGNNQPSKMEQYRIADEAATLYLKQKYGE